MEYREQPPSPRLAGLVKATWTLDAGGDAAAWAEHRATPDGCAEIIHRRAGQSDWHGAQPDCFVAGPGDQPALLRMSGDARFHGIRLWPWALPLLGGPPCGSFVNRWIAAPAPIRDAMTSWDPEAALAAIFAKGDTTAAKAMGAAILGADSVAGIVRASKLPMRALQRWFARNVGVAPRTYLKLLRFQDAFAGIGSAESLAAQAAASGFADQAHMTRAFRAMADTPPVAARRAAKGPFI